MVNDKWEWLLRLYDKEAEDAIRDTGEMGE
jgi:hypothetical protein